MWIMDTERGEMSDHHSQSEDEATISSILGTVFSVENEEAITMFSVKSNEEGITMFSAKLNEEAFEPLVEQGEMPSIPTEEELIKYPELEYPSREDKRTMYLDF